MSRAGYDFGAAYERVLEAAGVASQAALGAALGVSQSSVWDAKRRADGIPAGWLVTLVERYGANPEWIKTGLGPRRLSLPLEDAPLDKLVAEMVRRAVNETESTRRRGGFVRPEQPC